MGQKLGSLTPQDLKGLRHLAGVLMPLVQPCWIRSSGSGQQQQQLPFQAHQATTKILCFLIPHPERPLPGLVAGQSGNQSSRKHKKQGLV